MGHQPYKVLPTTMPDGTKLKNLASSFKTEMAIIGYVSQWLTLISTEAQIITKYNSIMSLDQLLSSVG